MVSYLYRSWQYPVSVFQWVGLPGRVGRMSSGGVTVACLVKMESKMENHELQSHQDSLQHYHCLVTKSCPTL